MDNSFTKALDIIESRRLNAESDYDSKVNVLHEKIPELLEVDNKLKQTGKLIFSAMFEKDSELSLSDIKETNQSLQLQKREILKKYNIDVNDLKPNYTCNLCNDYGYVGINMCQCLKKEIFKLRLLESEIGTLAEKQSFETFSFEYYPKEVQGAIKHNYDVLKEFSDIFSSKTFKNWLLIGDTGLGKTHLSTAVGVNIINNGYNVVYKSAQGMIEDFQEYQFRNGDSSLINKYYDCDLLIIDDLGVELATKFSISCLYNVLNTRLNREKSTLINTNLNQNELREVYSDRITSRLFGEFIPLVFKGTDIRRLKLSK